MQEVVPTLRVIISPEIICNFNEDNKNTYSLVKYEPTSKSSKGTVDINDDLHISNDSLILNTMSNITSLNINV